MQSHHAFQIYAGQVAHHRRFHQRRRETHVAAAELLLPVIEHADDVFRGVQLHQQIKGLMLQHDHAIDPIGDRDLTTQLVGYLAGSESGMRSKAQNESE